MLKRKYRLGAKTRIKPANSFSAPYFLLKSSKNNLPYNRFRFVVSKKISKSAVVRNRIKRNLGRGIESIFIQICTGYDFLFFARKEILGASSNEIALVIKETLRKKGFLK